MKIYFKNLIRSLIGNHEKLKTPIQNAYLKSIVYLKLIIYIPNKKCIISDLQLNIRRKKEKKKRSKFNHSSRNVL